MEKLEKEKSTKLMEFIRTNKDFGKEVRKWTTEERGTFMAACVAGLQVVFDVLPKEWEGFWEIISKGKKGGKL